MLVTFLQQELALFEDEERVNRQVGIANLLVWTERLAVVKLCIVHWFKS